MAPPLASQIDHTLLRPGAHYTEFDRLCEEALVHRFAAVCVQSAHVARCVRALDGKVAVASVCGFPLGGVHPLAKQREAAVAVHEGATEVDVVIDLGAARSGDWKAVEADLAGVVAACAPHAVKAIIEIALLTNDEQRTACVAAEQAGVAFVKTCTGFAGGGATVPSVQRLRAAVGPRVQVKASGGIRSRALALSLLQAGASRLGTSAGVALLASDDGGSP